MISTDEAIESVSLFQPGGDGLAEKSRELTLGLLRNSVAPFSRKQFSPGHLTCTALVLHPSAPLVLLMHHHRLRRWLLPGGHVETADVFLERAAAREATEETAVRMDLETAPFLCGIDVHGIPAKKQEPFHLHHDLIWCFCAASDAIEETDEATQVMWAAEADWDRLDLARAIRLSIERATRV